MHQFTNVNFSLNLSNPQQFGENCYELRKTLTDDELIPKSFFANLCDCSVSQIAQIENGHIYDPVLAIKYFLYLKQLHQYF